MQPARSEVGRSSPASILCASTAGPPRRSCARVLPCASSPYRKTGSCELAAKQIAEDKRLSARGAAVRRVEIHDRRHVDRADPGVNAFVAVHDIDPANRLGGALQNRVRQLAGLASEREHAAVVVGVGVDAEQASVERGTDRVDRVLVAALRDVRDRQQGGCHD